MKITILGSGTSTGVPEIGCKCPVCTSSDPRDNRLRCSGLIETEGLRILIDCGPDFREQMIRLNDFKPLDGVLITHEHYDHVGGLDDLRPFCRFRDVPVYAEQYTAERLRQRIPYCFAEHLYPGVPRITLEEICSRFSFSTDSDTLSIIDTCRNGYLYRLFACHITCSRTIRTFLFDNLPCSMTIRTSLYILYGSKEGLRSIYNLTFSTTFLASLRRSSRFCTCSVTCCTWVFDDHFQFFFHIRIQLLQM
mgnify:CR=1 FL=1